MIYSYFEHNIFNWVYMLGGAKFKPYLIQNYTSFILRAKLYTDRFGLLIWDIFSRFPKMIDNSLENLELQPVIYQT